MPIPDAISVALTEQSPLERLFQVLDGHDDESAPNALAGTSLLAEARAQLESLMAPDVYLHLEPRAVAMLVTLRASGLYGCDLEEVCIRLICEGLESRMETGVRLSVSDE